MTEINYGPLAPLIGVWKGQQGVDIAPESDGTERNEYRETLTFIPVGDVTNAESQYLVVLRYHQAVYRIKDNKVIHDQTGYWMWDEKKQIVMQSIAIPRAVTLVAGGSVETKGDNTLLAVSAGASNPGWLISQSPFMADNASTTDYQYHLTVNDEELTYRQTMLVDIYGEAAFEHTDENTLIKQI